MTTTNSLASSSNLNLKLKQISSENNAEFIRFRATMRLPIAPIWASNGSAGGNLGSGGMEGVKEVLAGWVMRYLPPLRAVLLTFDALPTFAHPTSTFSASSSPFPIQYRRPQASHLLASPEPGESDEEDEGEEPTTISLKALPMIAGSGFTLATVEWQGLGWRPRVGQKITGSPTLSTPSHISLLIHNLFNASIPVSQIPLDTYHFDPEFEVPTSIQLRQSKNSTWPSLIAAESEEVVEEEEETEKLVEEDQVEEDESEEKEEAVELAIEEEKAQEVEEEPYKERGWWRHNITKEPLGGESCRLEFTIFSLTIANSMISITGSLLSDPFSHQNLENQPKPKRSNSVPLKKRQRTQSDSSGSESSEAEEEEEEVVVAPPRIESAAIESDEEEEEEESSEEEVKVEIVKPKKAKKEKRDSKEKKEKKNSKKVKKVKKE